MLPDSVRYSDTTETLQTPMIWSYSALHLKDFRVKLSTKQELRRESKYPSFPECSYAFFAFLKLRPRFVDFTFDFYFQKAKLIAQEDGLTVYFP
jgi:hypothetical protein